MAGLSRARMAVAVAVVSGTLLPAPSAEAAGGCPASAGSGQAALRAAGLPGRVPGSWGARLSHDGRFVAFVSYEDDLVAGDTNQQADVFQMDRATQQITRVSLDPDGRDFREHAEQAAISADGTRVAFSAGPGVYLRDMGTAQTIPVSVDMAGAAADDWSGAPVLSPSGRFVAFTSRAADLVPTDRERGSLEAYLRDLVAGTTERISIGAGGLAARTWSWAGAVSDDGRHVAFTAGAAGGSLTAEDTYPGADVFVRDRQAQTTEVVSVAPDGRSMGGWFLGMSADGTKVLFGSGPQADAKPAAFLRDRAAGTTRLVAPLVTTWRRSTGAHPNPLAFIGQREGLPAALSADGRLAAIQTALPTGPEDTNGADDIVVVDVGSGAQRPVTLSSTGCPGNGASGEPAFSGAGSVVGFTSEANDLAGSDDYRLTDVFVRDLVADRTERIRSAPSTTP